MLTEDKCCQRRRAPARLAGRAYVDALRTWQGAFPYEIRYSLQRFISAQCAAVSGRTPAKRARTGYKECGFIREDGTLLTALGGGSARAGKDAREPSGRDMPVSGFANRPALRDWRRACGHGGARRLSVLPGRRRLAPARRARNGACPQIAEHAGRAVRNVLCVKQEADMPCP